MFSALIKKISKSIGSGSPHGADAYDSLDSTLPLLYLDESKMPAHWETIENHPPRERGFPVVGMKALLAPHREMLIRIKHNLRLNNDDYERLFDPILLRFLDFVYNLPSSQFNHHAGPGGALNHSLQVALQASQVASKYTLYKMRGGPEMGPKKIKKGEQYARIAIAIAGLLHDVGKPLTDLRVSLERPGKANSNDPVYWPAQTVGLRTWLIKMKATEYYITFRPGRGEDHKKIGRGALERFITPEIRQEFDDIDQSLLPRICDAIDCVNPDMDHFVRIVMEADQRSAQVDVAASEQRRTDRLTGLPVIHATLNALAEIVSRKPALVNQPGGILWNTDQGVFIDFDKAFPHIRKYRTQELSQAFPVTQLMVEEDLVNGEYCERWSRNGNTGGPYWPVTPDILVKGRDPSSIYLWMLKLSDKSHLRTDLPHVVSATIVPAKDVYQRWKKLENRHKANLRDEDDVDLGDEYEQEFEKSLQEPSAVVDVPSAQAGQSSLKVDRESGEVLGDTEVLPSPSAQSVTERSPPQDQASTAPSIIADGGGSDAKDEETGEATPAPESMLDALQVVGDDIEMPFDTGSVGETDDSKPVPASAPPTADASSKLEASINAQAEHKSTGDTRKKALSGVDASSLNLSPGAGGSPGKKKTTKKGGKDPVSADTMLGPANKKVGGAEPKAAAKPDAPAKPEAPKQRSAITSAVKGPSTYQEFQDDEKRKRQKKKRATPTTREAAWGVVKRELKPLGEAGDAIVTRLAEVIDGDSLVGESWFFHNKQHFSVAYPKALDGMPAAPLELKKQLEDSGVLIFDTKHPHKAVFEIDGVLGLMFVDSISIAIRDLVKLAEFDRDPFGEMPDPALKYHRRHKETKKKTGEIDMSPSDKGSGRAENSKKNGKALEKDIMAPPPSSEKKQNSPQQPSVDSSELEYDKADISSIVTFMYRCIPYGNCKWFKGYTDNGLGQWTLDRDTFRAVTADCSDVGVGEVRRLFLSQQKSHGYLIKSVSSTLYIMQLEED